MSVTVPIRNWIKTAIVAYQADGSMTNSQIEWNANHFDWFDSPHAPYIATYKANTNAPLLVYVNYYCLYVGQDQYTALVTYCTDHSINIETMFLHFDVETSVTLLGVTHILPAGSRVPTYSWYSTDGDLTADSARVIMNVKSANYCAFLAEYMQTLMGESYTGLFIDNTMPGVILANCTINSGGTFSEYSGQTRSQASSSFDTDIANCFSAVATAITPRTQYPNTVYSNISELWSYIDGQFHEFYFQLTGQTRVTYEDRLATLDSSHANSLPSIISVLNLGSTATDSPANKMSALSAYYIASESYDYFCRQDSNSGDPAVWMWFGALEYNVGQRKASRYTFSIGADPTSAKNDSGTCTVTQNGSNYTITDTSKNWATDYWSGLKFIDSVGTVINVWHSTATTCTFYNPATPPVAGVYGVGNSVYKVHAREYDNVLALYKPISASGYATDSTSETTHDLPITDDDPSGTYYKLAVDGTVSETPLTSITLKNGEGVVLVKELDVPYATEYSLTVSDPSSGNINTQSANFTLSPTNGYWPVGCVITSASNKSATFSPTTLSPSGNSAITFKFTPTITGEHTVSVTNDAGMTNPASVAYTANPADSAVFDMTGPSSGTISTLSTLFTINPVGGSWPSETTITLACNHLASVFPATLSPTGTSSATFAIRPYEPGITSFVVSCTNNKSMTNPSTITYTASLDYQSAVAGSDC